MTDDHAQGSKNRQGIHATRRTPQLLLAVLIASIPLGVANGHPTDTGDATRVTFEKVFLAVFPNVFTSHGASQPLTSTMVIHNVDPEIEITISNADYFDQNGQLVKSFLRDPIVLAPRKSHPFIVKVKEQPSGFAARFLVEWSAEKPAISPILEGVMIGGAGTQGISFTTTGKVIESHP